MKEKKLVLGEIRVGSKNRISSESALKQLQQMEVFIREAKYRVREGNTTKEIRRLLVYVYVLLKHVLESENFSFLSLSTCFKKEEAQNNF